MRHRGARQFGTFGRGTIGAWAATSVMRYNLVNLPLRPRVSVVDGISSGDRDPKSADLQTYNPLFPTGAYFNLADPVGPSNFIHFHPGIDMRFPQHLTVTVDWKFFWRTSTKDAIYRLSVVPLRTGKVSRARYVGNAPALTVRWAATRHIAILASYVHFFAGPFLEQTPPGKDLDYFTTWVTYKF